MKQAVGMRVVLEGVVVCRRGTAAIEFAVVLPVLLLFAFGLVDLGRAMWTQTTLDYTAQATARCAAISINSTDTTATCYSNSGADWSNVKTYGATQAYGITLSCTAGSGVNCVVPSKVTTCNSQSVSAVQAIVATNFTYFMPLLSHFSGQFTATACYPT